MASEIKLWQLHEGKLQDVNDSFAAEHLEPRRRSRRDGSAHCGGVDAVSTALPMLEQKTTPAGRTAAPGRRGFDRARPERCWADPWSQRAALGGGRPGSGGRSRAVAASHTMISRWPPLPLIAARLRPTSRSSTGRGPRWPARPWRRACATFSRSPISARDHSASSAAKGIARVSSRGVRRRSRLVVGSCSIQPWRWQ